MRDELFVYGTLHPDRAPAEVRAVVDRMTPIGEGSVAGHLHQLEGYPGLVIDGKSRQRVPGHVFKLPDDPAALDVLDGYEEVDPSNPSKSLFRRDARIVTLVSGRRKKCWVYVYNQPLPLVS